MDGRGYEERLESGVSIQGAVIGPVVSRCVHYIQAVKRA